MKKAGKTAGKLILFVGILAAMLLTVQSVLKLDMEHRGTDIVNEFYLEEENSIDVLFIGSSTMFCTMDPLVLYEEYGITSFDMGSSAQPFALSYLFLQEALKYQKPKVVGLEVLSLEKILDTNKAENLSYGTTDMKLSKEKIAGIYDMFRDNKGAGVQYLIPLFQYKDRWQELTKEDFRDSAVYYTKGAYTPDKVSDAPLDFSGYYEEEEVQIPAENLEIFQKIAGLCRENDIELVLFKGPNIGWNIGGSEAVQELADEYGVPFIDFIPQLDTIGVDMAADFRDLSHLNRHGSRKASLYMGEFLKEHYKLEDHRAENTENSWDRALDIREHDRSNEIMSRTGDLETYMSRIPYKGHTVAFCFSGDTAGIDDYMRTRLALIGVDASILESGGSFVIDDGVCISGMIAEDGETWNKDIGANDALQLTKYSITLNRDVYQLVDDGVTVLIYDKEWERLVDVVGFDTEYPAYGVRKTED